MLSQLRSSHLPPLPQGKSLGKTRSAAIEMVLAAAAAAAADHSLRTKSCLTREIITGKTLMACFIIKGLKTVTSMSSEASAVSKMESAVERKSILLLK